MDKDKHKVIMEALGYVRIPWNDKRKLDAGIKGPAIYYPIKMATLPLLEKLVYTEQPRWNFIVESASALGITLKVGGDTTFEQAYYKLYKFCYKKLNKVPKNQLNLFLEKEPKTCACGKNPECACKKC